MDWKKLKFGLAPMAGYTDAAFRLLCKEYGADFAVTELISAESIIRGNEQGFRLAFVSEEERKLNPTGIQLFGSDPTSLAKAAELLEKDADFIDLNFGCPALKVTRNMGGAALLAKPEKIKEIVETVSSTIKKPTTAKMRLGIRTSTNALAIAKTIEKAGASALFVHARNFGQGYSGIPDWSKIEEIKRELSIPVFGNGNVVSQETAKKMFEETNCDGVLIGRAAIGNPFVFEELKSKKKQEVTFARRKVAFLRYLELRNKLKMRESLGDLKGQAIAFVQGMPGASEMRLRISQSSKIEEIMEFVQP